MFGRAVTAFAFVVGIASGASASTIVVVPGTSNPWLAGMPAGTTAVIGDVAPAQSPVQVGISVVPGEVLWIFATGSTDHCPSGGCGLAGPDGDAGEGPTSHLGGSEHGIGDIIAPIDSLIGVFLGPAQPDGSAAPALANYSTAALQDLLTISPLLKQPFFIGDGLRANGLTAQNFLVPAGATRLFLGPMDGYEWNNNSGELRVTVSAVPEPATLTLVGLGLAGALRRRRSLGQ